MLLCGLFFRLRLHGIPVVDGSLAYRRQAGAADPHLAGERHRDAMLLQHLGDGFVPGTGQRSPVEARVMVKVPSAADAAVGAGGWNASLCNCASSHPAARAVSRTRAINPGGPQK